MRRAVYGRYITRYGVFSGAVGSERSWSVREVSVWQAGCGGRRITRREESAAVRTQAASRDPRMRGGECGEEAA